MPGSHSSATATSSSGYTGNPPCHGKHLAATDTVVSHYPTLHEKPHRTVVFLPMCQVLDRDAAITLPLISQLVPHFGEDPEDFALTLFEVAPTVLFMVPRYLQKFASRVLVGIFNASRIKRAAHNFAMRFAHPYATRRWSGGSNLLQDAIYWVVQAAVFKPISTSSV